MNSPEEHFGAERVDLNEVEFTAELLACVPAHYARRFRVLPVSQRPGFIVLAMEDPSDLPAIDALHHFLDCELELCVAGGKQLDEFIAQLYGREDGS